MESNIYLTTKYKATREWWPLISACDIRGMVHRVKFTNKKSARDHTLLPIQLALPQASDREEPPRLSGGVQSVMDESETIIKKEEELNKRIEKEFNERTKDSKAGELPLMCSQVKDTRSPKSCVLLMSLIFAVR